MKHYGNVTKINGAEVEPVDIITFGSPCQDLSVAGKRAGIQDGERSNLFFEAVRIIKEMRESTNGEYPKYAVWENVPGAFSSNKGRDFHAVLEALCSVCDDTVSIPKPYDAKRTKLVWNKAGEIVGDNYSIAWRTLDAQYWGVPQRRKRIYLVADFTGRCAGEILFKSDSLRGNMQEGDEAREGVTADAVGSIDGSVGVVGLTNRGIECETAFETLRAGSHGALPLVAQKQSADGSVGVECLNPWDAQSIRQYSASGTYPTLSNNATGGQNRQGVVYALQANGIDRADTAGCNGAGWRENESYTLNTVDRHAVCFEPGAMVRDMGNRVWDGQSPTLRANMGDNQPAVCYPLNEQIILRHGALGKNTGFGAGEDGDPAYTLQANHPHAVCYQGQVGALQARDYKGVGSQYVGEEKLIIECYDARGNGDGERACYTMQRSDEYQACEVASTQSARQYKSATDLVVEKKRRYIIRRLTPTECARLQGFPDDWGKLAPYNPADAEFWEDVRKTHAEINGKKYKPTKNLKKWYDKLHTDSAEYKAYGNGLALPCAEYVIRGTAEQGAKTLGSLFDGIGGFPLAGAMNGITPLWASEVEPYAIAVTKSRFGEVK